jgi:hypothetical protein
VRRKECTEVKKQVMKRRGRKTNRSVGKWLIMVNTALLKVDKFSETLQLIATRCEYLELRLA